MVEFIPYTSISIEFRKIGVEQGGSMNKGGNKITWKWGASPQEIRKRDEFAGMSLESSPNVILRFPMLRFVV